MYGVNDCGTVCSFDVDGSKEMMVNLYASLLGKQLIWIPRGPSICPVFRQPEKPELYCDSQILDKNAAYIISGMGVVAGEEAYKKLNDDNTVLQWE